MQQLSKCTDPPFAKATFYTFHSRAAKNNLINVKCFARWNFRDSLKTHAFKVLEMNLTIRDCLRKLISDCNSCTRFHVGGLSDGFSHCTANQKYQSITLHTEASQIKVVLYNITKC